MIRVVHPGIKTVTAYSYLEEKLTVVGNYFSRALNLSATFANFFRLYRQSPIDQPTVKQDISEVAI